MLNLVVKFTPHARKIKDSRYFQMVKKDIHFGPGADMVGWLGVGSMG